ncbi:MAG: hypothetical protein DRQ39_03680 [Gammaproteobacteria bacterium]|nr:MAG: hypothetical protein DRQ39_03680 [Gammaproteobacteria bacterium]RKZ94698.1 MAG: hypothetical protein DRQ40_05290 [Gammaproteobacteria bacterium]
MSRVTFDTSTFVVVNMETKDIVEPIEQFMLFDTPVSVSVTNDASHIIIGYNASAGMQEHFDYRTLYTDFFNLIDNEGTPVYDYGLYFPLTNVNLQYRGLNPAGNTLWAGAASVHYFNNGNNIMYNALINDGDLKSMFVIFDRDCDFEVEEGVESEDLP